MKPNVRKQQAPSTSLLVLLTASRGFFPQTTLTELVHLLRGQEGVLVGHAHRAPHQRQARGRRLEEPQADVRKGRMDPEALRMGLARAHGHLKHSGQRAGGS